MTNTNDDLKQYTWKEIHKVKCKRPFAAISWCEENIGGNKNWDCYPGYMAFENPADAIKFKLGFTNG